MDRWPHKIGLYAMREILAAVADSEWQKFRVSLKGLPTTEKLDRLDQYLFDNREQRPCRCRVDNYINALRRGGQLNLQNEVQR